MYLGQGDNQDRRQAAAEHLICLTTFQEYEVWTLVVGFRFMDVFHVLV
jgi:hypothetical protein